MFANGLGWPHLLIVALVFVVLFGAKRLPEDARAVGKSLRILKEETRGLSEDGTAQVPAASTGTQQDQGTARAPQTQPTRPADPT